jgi:divalent metal cation (Fe/Co/Zn/Cd) transporter
MSETSKKKSSGKSGGSGGSDMNKKIILALIIFALAVVVMLFNMKGGSRVDLNLVITTVKDMYTSVAFLIFTLVGVVIGVLLK